MHENQKIRGHVTITYRDVTDPNKPFVISVEEIENLIVKTGKNLEAHFLAGASVGGITKIGFGTGGSVPTAVTDVGITGGVMKATTNTSYLISDAAYNQAKFSATMLSEDGNGSTFNELGLFTANNTMFSRLCISPKAKDITTEINADWVISFQ